MRGKAYDYAHGYIEGRKKALKFKLGELQKAYFTAATIIIALLLLLQTKRGERRKIEVYLITQNHMNKKITKYISGEH